MAAASQFIQSSSYGAIAHSNPHEPSCSSSSPPPLPSPLLFPLYHLTPSDLLAVSSSHSDKAQGDRGPSSRGTQYISPHRPTEPAAAQPSLLFRQPPSISTFLSSDSFVSFAFSQTRARLLDILFCLCLHTHTHNDLARTISDPVWPQSNSNSQYLSIAFAFTPWTPLLWHLPKNRLSPPCSRLQ